MYQFILSSKTDDCIVCCKINIVGVRKREGKREREREGDKRWREGMYQMEQKREEVLNEVSARYLGEG